jgi:hypothetical protein
MPIAIQRRDGGVSILRPIAQPSAAPDLGPIAPDIAAEIEKWSGVHVGEYLSHHLIDEADIPADRTFRNAWASDGLTIVHDMGKARGIHREVMRRARAAQLAALDIAYSRADETGDEAGKAAIAAQKQALRNVTADPRIDAAQTPAELKAVWPEVLSAPLADGAA